MSSAPPRPKPWESSSSAQAPSSVTSTAAAAAATSSDPSTTTTGGAASSPNTTTTTTNPALPARPTSLNSQPPLMTSYTPYGSTGGVGGGYGMSGYGMSGYGGGAYGSGYASSYSSPYSRYGGGYGAGYGGYGGYGSAPPPFGAVDPNDPNSMTRNFESSTQATFQLIESIVGAVGGFAQMLESTYMATHSSFFAMMSVAQQLGNLRNSLGSLFGIFTVVGWIKKILAKLTGRKLVSPAASQLTPAKFAEFEAAGGGVVKRQRPSFKPLIMFLAAIFGLPYLMGRLIKALADKQNEELRLQQPPPQHQQEQSASSLDLSKLEFYRAIYDFNPENPRSNWD